MLDPSQFVGSTPYAGQQTQPPPKPKPMTPQQMMEAKAMAQALASTPAGASSPPNAMSLGDWLASRAAATAQPSNTTWQQFLNSSS